MDQKWLADRMTARLNRKDGGSETAALEWALENGTIYAQVPARADWSGIASVDFAPELACAAAGDDGYYVVPHDQQTAGDTYLCYYREREDCEAVNRGMVMPMYGVIGKRFSCMAVVTGMTYDYELVVGVRNGSYYLFPRVQLDGHAPYETIRVEFRLLEGEKPDYNDVAHAYQDWQRVHAGMISLRERKHSRPKLDYGIRSVYVRIRHGWKPVPPKVLEQTDENEPEMHVASTFADVEALMKEFHAQGVRYAEFCLVGWNYRGHDGRWPQIFPVEPELGGEEGLRSLIETAKKLDYSIVCHTNSTDTYSVADCWDPEDVVHLRDGSLSVNDCGWSGGRMYHLCAEPALRQAQELLPQVAKLGFTGLHYIDVISTISPRACYSHKHPMTARQTAETWREIMRLSRSLFGGFSSEGGYDFAVPELDFGLYVSFGLKPCPLADECVPLWQLVYHGYVLSNPYTTTVNPSASDLLKVVEYGGRPTFYYDSRFVTQDETHKNWMGEEDFHCATEADRRESTAYIARVAKLNELLWPLQEETMLRHERLDAERVRVTYSDGSQIEVDYGRGEAYLNGRQILPLA